MITIRDEQHTELDKVIAWVVPTLHSAAKKLGLE
jgi:hypothetical protein